MEEQLARLGRTELRVPVCGLGGIPVGKDQLSDDEASDLIRQAIDGGLTLIDTFSNYGRSELRIGQAIRGRRDDVTLVTKARSNFTPQDFREQVEGALERLQVDCIDVLLMKNVDDDPRLANISNLDEVLDALRAEGKIRFTGLSSHSADHACAAIETGIIDVAEVPYNYANRVFEKVLDLAVERDVGILAMKPLGGGRLFGQTEKGAPATLETLVQALSFASSHPSQPVLIPGIGSQAELDRYLEAIPRLRVLSETERQALTDRAQDLGTDFCRACGYCRSVCPSGIPIDEILPLLDRFQHIQTDQTYRQQMQRSFAALGADPNACSECRKCIEECPFNLPVPGRLKEAFDVLRVAR